MIVRTIRGDIAPGDLGATYVHEHLIIDSPAVADNWPHIHLPSTQDAVSEVRSCQSAGVRSMVDAMPTGSGRNVKRLLDISTQTGMNIIATAGMHTIKYYRGVPWADDPTDALIERFTSEILGGMEGTPSRAGVMKVAMSGKFPTAQEEQLFETAGRVHETTGVPILTHCEDGAGAFRQIELLTMAGVEPSHMVLSHTDKRPDPSYHADILDTGAMVEYDQALRQKLNGSTTTAALVAAMWERGFGAQIMLGTDGARRSLWASLGGEPGLAWLKTGFPELLIRHGLAPEQIDTMFVDNPARWLAFAPPGGH